MTKAMHTHLVGARGGRRRRGVLWAWAGVFMWGCGVFSTTEWAPDCTEEGCLGAQALGLYLEAPQQALLGEFMWLCVGAASDSNLRPSSIGLSAPKLWRGEEEAPLEWEGAEEGPWRVCKKALLPLHLQAGEWSLEARVEATDKAGVRRAAGESLKLRLTRIACSHEAVGVGGSIARQPLVVSNGRVVFAAGSGLYFFEVGPCSMEATSPIQTGATQGPMVALGNSGKLAAVLGGRGQGQRLALVEGWGIVPGGPGEGCLQGSNVNYERGLSLLSFPATSGSGTPWRLAATANGASDNQTRLVAYILEDEASPRCVSSPEFPFPASIPTAQKANAEVVSVHIFHLSEFYRAVRLWHFEGNAWTLTQTFLNSTPIGNPTSMAIAGENTVWLTDIFEASPVVVDSRGRAYFVGKNAGSRGYQLQRYAAEAELGYWGAQPEATSVELSTPPVGSPLLGEAMGEQPEEVYVVTTGGKVLAYRAERLGEPLWTESLGFNILPEVQPVLVADTQGGGGTLWLIGAGGQIRGLRVGSAGLNRTAHWPKAFRDNCNTGSRQVNAGNMPGCY